MNTPSVITAALFVALSASLSHLSAAAAQVRSQPCDEIILVGPETIELSPNEKSLVCGSDSRAGWGEIPDNQATYFIRAFLEQRGYHAPSFSRRDGALEVTTGEITKVKNVIMSEQTEFTFQTELERLLADQTLSPGILNRTEGWIQRELNQQGYPCAQVRVLAVVDTKTLLVDYATGEQQLFPSPHLANETTLSPLIFERFQAFIPGTRYDSRLLELTERRAVESGVVRSTFLSTACLGDTIAVTQRVFPSAPKNISLGIGFNTEELLLGRAAWRHARMGELGSSVSLTAFLSGRTQRLSINSDWFFLPELPRLSLQSVVGVQQKIGKEYRTISLNTETQVTHSIETGDNQIVLQSGPNYVTERTYGDDAPSRSIYLSIDSRITITSHLLEYYRNPLRTGYRFSLWNSTATRHFYSTFDASRFGLEGSHLFNYRSFDPPQFVVDMRYQAGTTWVPRTHEVREKLPVRYRHHLGGGRSFRGFAREELPGTGKIALTSISLGTDLRYSYVHFPSVQPFVLLDVAQLGKKPLQLDKPWYWAPGFGILWVSPVGTIRGSLAHGFLANPSPSMERETHWQFYASLGEEM